MRKEIDMKRVIDAKGEACPMPVVRAKKAFDEGATGVEISVDNKIAVENLEKLAKTLGSEFSFEEKSETEFVCTIGESIKEEANEVLKAANDNIVVVISSKYMGNGDETLGANLLKGFIYSLTQADKLPKTVLFYNSGAFITTTGSASIDDLKVLEAAGVEIMTCGACLNHYNLADKLEVGSVTNMYEIVEKQLNASNIIRP